MGLSLVRGPDSPPWVLHVALAVLEQAMVGPVAWENMLVEQTIVMTGASRGIGWIAAQRLLAERPGAHLVIFSRGPSRELVDQPAVLDGRLSSIGCDLSSLPNTRDAADAVLQKLSAGGLPPLGALVCNAGVQHTNACTQTDDGFESTFAVNVLAHHVLIRRLQSALSPQGRIVVTVSDTHFGDLRHNLGMVPGPRWQPVEALARPGAFDRPSSTTAGRRAYSTSKLASIHLIHEFARRFPSGPTIVGFNPGFVPGTDLAREADVASRLVMRRIMPLLAVTPLASTPEQAGSWLASVVTGDLEAPTGAYIDRDTVQRSSAQSYDARRELEAWDAVERLTQSRL
ncbi:protochlorophyllide reductase [Kocuria palustris]